MTPKQFAVLAYIGERITATGSSPTFQTIANHFGLSSKAAVARFVVILEKHKFIRRTKSQASNIEVTKAGWEHCARAGGGWRPLSSFKRGELNGRQYVLCRSLQGEFLAITLARADQDPHEMMRHANDAYVLILHPPTKKGAT